MMSKECLKSVEDVVAYFDALVSDGLNEGVEPIGCWIIDGYVFLRMWGPNMGTYLTTHVTKPGSHVPAAEAVDFVWNKLVYATNRMVRLEDNVAK